MPIEVNGAVFDINRSEEYLRTALRNQFNKQWDKMSCVLFLKNTAALSVFTGLKSQ